jgi:MFS family permease
MCTAMKMVEQASLPLSLSVRSNVALAGDLSTWQSTGLKVATPVGNLVGQLVFGWLADILGRKRMCE